MAKKATNLRLDLNLIAALNLEAEKTGESFTAIVERFCRERLQGVDTDVKTPARGQETTAAYEPWELENLIDRAISPLAERVARLELALRDKENALEDSYQMIHLLNQQVNSDDDEDIEDEPQRQTLDEERYIQCFSDDYTPTFEPGQRVKNIKTGKEYQVVGCWLADDDIEMIEYRCINPKTGEVWQSAKTGEACKYTALQAEPRETIRKVGDYVTNPGNFKGYVKKVWFNIDGDEMSSVQWNGIAGLDDWYSHRLTLIQASMEAA